ncbi:MAG: Spy/CpxP family protein refolding chaperone [Hyphomonadaceae bacterium]
MGYLAKSLLLSVALGLGACASMGGAHHQAMEARATTEHEGEEADHDMQCPMMGMMTPLIGCHGAAGDVDARLAGMRASLAITPAQESAWAAYADAYRAHAGRMQTMMSGMHERAEAAPISIPQRFQRHDAMMAQHMSVMQPLRAAIEALYATLSDEQRTNADALSCD